VSQDGRLLKRASSWNFHVRPPLIVYMVAEQGNSALWTFEPASGKTAPLTDSSARILAFDVSHNGDFIIFSAINDQQGIDLWRIRREGGEPVLLLPCGLDRCSEPAISNFDRRVAYVREAAGPSLDLQYGAPRIWILDLETQQNAPVYEDQQIIGYGPVWSPDGTRLSSFDGLADEIRLLDILTGNQLIIPSQTGNPVTWSADGNRFLYTDIAVRDSGLHTRVRQANLVTSEITTLLGENDQQDYNYKSLAWSPVEDKLVIGLRTDENSRMEGLWLMDPRSLGGQMIAEQPNYVYGNPRWDPWGKALIFQQFDLKQKYESQISLWRPGWKEPQVLTEGIMPRWLP
jgi:Tol biopolymer transport system component